MSIVRLDTGKGPPADDQAEAEFVESLRLRAADSLEQAYGFLQSRADPWARLRADVLCEAAPASAITERFVSQQQGDGSLPRGTLVSGGALGFPMLDWTSLSDEDERVVGTLEALLLAGDAKVLHGEWVEPAARFFERVQADDGAFRLTVRTAESTDFAGRAADDDVYWTGMIAGILGRTRVARPKLLDAAGEFLSARFRPEAVEQDGYSALLAYAHFFTNVAHEDSDESLQWCGRALEKGFRSRQLDAVATVRVLLTCDAQAMPGATFDVVELLDRLLSEQAGDGGFAELSPEGPDARTSQTFDAMLAIVRLCAALGET